MNLDKRLELYINLFYIDKIFDSSYLIDFQSVFDLANRREYIRKSERRRRCSLSRNMDEDGGDGASNPPYFMKTLSVRPALFYSYLCIVKKISSDVGAI